MIILCATIKQFILPLNDLYILAALIGMTSRQSEWNSANLTVMWP